MAVLGDRATGVLDMLIESFRDQSMPNQQLAPTMPGQGTVLSPELVGRVSPPAVATIQTNPALNQAPSMPLGQGVARTADMPAMVTAQPQQAIDANRLISGRSMQAGQGVMQPGMDREAMLRAGKIADDAIKSGDESLISRVQGFFGGRENMLRLAMAFNTMRLQPDAQLTAALSSQLEAIEKNRVAQMSQGDIINYLQQNGYPQLAQVAAKNPKMAQTIMEQVLQKELKPAASAKPFSPIQDPDSGQMSIPVYDPETNTTNLVPIPGAITETPAEEAARQTEEAVRLKDLDEGLKAANSAFERANLYRNDINQLYKALAAAEDPNTQTGFLNQFLPAFTSSTAALREAGNRLGLGVVSSVTFGALSASELSLALKTGLDLTLPRPELIKEIERRIGAQEKLYEEMMKDAELLASGIGKKEFIKIVAERRKRNKQIADKLPELQQKRTISKGAWQQLNANQQLQLLEKNGIVVEFVQ